MDDIDQGALHARIMRHEGYEARPYRDRKGIWTVGWGHQLQDDRMLPYTHMRTLGELLDAITNEDQHLKWLADEIQDATVRARGWMQGAWYRMCGVRKEVIVELCYWMGNRPAHPTKGFVETKAALDADDYATAADEMMDSQAGRNQKTRMLELANLMRNGTLPQ